MHEPRAKNLETLWDHKHSYADSFIPSEALLSSLSLHLHLLWDNPHEGARGDSCQKGRTKRRGLTGAFPASRSLPELICHPPPLPEIAPIFRYPMIATRGQKYFPVARPLVAVRKIRPINTTKLSSTSTLSSPFEKISRILRQFLDV